MHKSITARYFYSTAMLLLASIAVLGFIQMYLSVDYFRETSEESMLATIDITVHILQEQNDAEPSHAAVLPSSSIAREIAIAARVSGNLIYITDATGRVLLSNEGVAAQDLPAQLPEQAMHQAQENGQYTEMGTLGGMLPMRCYVAGKPVAGQSGEVRGYVFAATDASGLTAYISNMFSTFVLSAGLMLMVSSVLSIVLTTRMTTPLRRIADAAKRFGNNDFSARVPVEGEDELAALSVIFNNMAANLEKIDQSRRSFMGNLAHELRTPMTTVKGFVDGMLDGTIPPESREYYLDIVSQEVGRLTRLIKNMLDITKLEAGEYRVNAASYDVWETITSVVFAAEQRIEARHIKVTGFAPSKTLVYADADLVYQVVQNLTDNAVKFCNEGGEIRFDVSQFKNMVTITIRNTGEGIEEDALPFVFDRFYKEDKSRGLNTAGSGLGLHICKVLVTLSGGNIWANSKAGQFAEFSFTLPAEPPPMLKG